MNPVARALTYLRNNETYRSATVEMLGSILPHLAMVMNRFEFYDQAIVQLGNFSTVFGINNLWSKVIDRVQWPLMATANGDSRDWLHLAKSTLLFGNIASYVMASPALRNAIMVRVSQTTDFINMVGLNGNQKEYPETIRAVSNQNFRTFAKFYGTGLAITGTLGLLATLAGKHNLPLPGLLKLAQKHLGLPGGNYSKMPTASAVLFWALPTYAGFYTFSRDKVEVKETLAKAAGFTFAFAILPKAIKAFLEKPLTGKTIPLIGSGENGAFLGEVVSACVLYSAIPTFLNLFLRKKRAMAAGLISEGDSGGNEVLPLLQVSAAPVVSGPPLSSNSPVPKTATITPPEWPLSQRLVHVSPVYRTLAIPTRQQLASL